MSYSGDVFSIVQQLWRMIRRVSVFRIYKIQNMCGHDCHLVRPACVGSNLAPIKKCFDCDNFTPFC